MNWKKLLGYGDDSSVKYPERAGAGVGAGAGAGAGGTGAGTGAGSGAGGAISILRASQPSSAAEHTIEMVAKNMRAGIMNVGGQMGLWTTTLKEYRMIDIPSLKCKICRKLFWEILKDGDDLMRLSKVVSNHSEALHAESCTSSSFHANYQKEVRSVPPPVVSAAQENRKNLADIFSGDATESSALVTGEFFRYPADFKPSLREQQPRTDEWWAEDVNDHPFVCTRCYMDPQVFYENRRHPEEYRNVEDMINAVQSKEDPMKDAYGRMYEALNASAIRRFHSKRIPFEVDDESANFRNFGHVDPFVYFKLLSGQVDGIPNIGVSESGIALPLDKHRYVTASLIQPMFVHVDEPQKKKKGSSSGGEVGADEEEEEEDESDEDDDEPDSTFSANAGSKYHKPVSYDEFKRLMMESAAPTAAEPATKRVLQNYVMVDVCVQKISVALVDQDPTYAFVASKTTCGPACGMTSWRYLPGMFCLMQIAPSTRGHAFVVPAIFLKTKSDETLAEIELALPKRDFEVDGPEGRTDVDRRGGRIEVDVQSLASSSVGFAPNRIYVNSEATELFSTFPEVVDVWEPDMILDNRSHTNDRNLLARLKKTYNMTPRIEDFSNMLTTLKMSFMQGIPVLVGHLTVGQPGSYSIVTDVTETRRIWSADIVPESFPLRNLSVHGGGVGARVQSGEKYVLFLTSEGVSELSKPDPAKDALGGAFLMKWNDFDFTLRFTIGKMSNLLQTVEDRYGQDAGVVRVLKNIRTNVFSGKLLDGGGGGGGGAAPPPGYDLKALLSGYSLEGVNEWLVQLRRSIFDVVCRQAVSEIRTDNREAKILRRTLEPSSFGRDSGNPIYHNALPDFSSDLEAAAFLSYSAICVLAQSATLGTASLTLNAANRVLGHASSRSISHILAGLSRTWSAALAFGKNAFEPKITIQVIRLLNSEGSAALETLLAGLPEEVKTSDALRVLTSSSGIKSHFSKLCSGLRLIISSDSDLAWKVTRVQEVFGEHIEMTKLQVMGFRNAAGLSPFCADRLYTIFELFNIDSDTRMSYSTETSVCSILKTLLPKFIEFEMKAAKLGKVVTDSGEVVTNSREVVTNSGEVVTAMTLLLAGAIAEDLKSNSEIKIKLVEETSDDGAVESAFDSSFFDKTNYSISMKPESELLRTFFRLEGESFFYIPASVISEISILRKFAEACSTNPSLTRVYFNMRGEFAELVIGAAVGHMYADVLMRNGVGVFINGWMAAVHAGAVKRPEDLMDSTLIEISRNLGTRVDSDIARELQITLRSNRERQLDLTLRSAWPGRGQELRPNPTGLVRHVYVQKFPFVETRIRGINQPSPDEALLFEPLLSRENYRWASFIRSKHVPLKAFDLFYLLSVFINKVVIPRTETFYKKLSELSPLEWYSKLKNSPEFPVSSIKEEDISLEFLRTLLSS
jgi:hypothetical protein